MPPVLSLPPAQTPAFDTHAHFMDSRTYFSCFFATFRFVRTIGSHSEALIIISDTSGSSANAPWRTRYSPCGIVVHNERFLRQPISNTLALIIFRFFSMIFVFMPTFSSYFVEISNRRPTCRFCTPSPSASCEVDARKGMTDITNLVSFRFVLLGFSTSQ